MTQEERIEMEQTLKNLFREVDQLTILLQPYEKQIVEVNQKRLNETSIVSKIKLAQLFLAIDAKPSP